MRSPQPLPQALTNRSFTLEEASLNGVSRRRTESSDLTTPSRGIRVPWGATQAFADSMRPLLRVTPGAVVGFSTAACLWGIPLPGDLGPGFAVHLICPHGTSAPRRKGVRGHSMRLPPTETTTLDGIAVTTPARTWFDLAQLISVDALVAAGDHVVNRNNRIFAEKREALASVEELSQMLTTHCRSRGVRTAREALPLVRVGCDSAPETALRLALLRAGLPEPVLGWVITDEAGGHVVWPDLAYPTYKIAIQYDGAHHLDRGRQELDIARNEATVRAGWTQVIITARLMDAFGSAAAVVKVRDALMRNGWDGRRHVE